MSCRPRPIAGQPIAILLGVQRIIVLGMHRSGTSAITRALGLLGASMGVRSHLGKHWENGPLRRINASLLTAAGGTWDAPPTVTSATWSELSIAELGSRARQALADEFGDAPVMVWKDPRTCITLPFWLELLESEPVFVLIYRHPSEVAASLAARNKFSSAHSYTIWERYNGDALRAAAGLPMVVVDYGRMLAQPVEIVHEVVRWLGGLGVELPNDPATTDLELVAQQRHHEAGEPDALDGAVATTSQHDLFALLRELEGPHDALALPRPVPEPNPLSVELLALAGQVRRLRSSRRSGGGKNNRRPPAGDGEPAASADGQPEAAGSQPSNRLSA